MKSKNLIILCVWLAITTIFVVLSVFGVVYTTTVQPTQWLLWMFNDWFTVFIVGLIFTGIIVFFLKEPEVELSNELGNIQAKIGNLSEQIQEIKKIIEE
jgi:hypothetical protein